MKKDIIADINPHETRIALREDGEREEIQIEMRGQERLCGKIYKCRGENGLPGMQAAFVDVGLERNAFLYAGDILQSAKLRECVEVSEQKKKKDKDKTPSISELVRPGQEIMVQVLKQQGGTKGARITTHITLPGRSIVLMPTVDHIGISHKITDEEERERLKDIFLRIKPEGMGMIVRTAAEGATEERLATEVVFLSRLWANIKRREKLLGAPRLIHAEEPLLFRTVRDMFDENVRSLIVNDYEYSQKVAAMVAISMPGAEKKVHFYDRKENIYDYYGIESKIDKALNRKVWLKSGAYLVIDETEALTVIDVNTGKYTGKSDLQSTILSTNIEAAREIAHQLRLRDIGGIIVVDFIDMESQENKDAVIQALEEALKKDRTKTNVIGMSALGLVEMTRKKTRRKLSSKLMSTCPHCGGRGLVYSDNAMAMRVRREVVRYVCQIDAPKYLVEVAPSVLRFIAEKNNRGEALLPEFSGKVFYMAENTFAHTHEIRVSVRRENRPTDKLTRLQVFY